MRASSPSTSPRAAGSAGGRPTCLRCLRAQPLCWCGRVRPFETEARFCILMHPKERRVAIGTGRMTHRALVGSTLLVGLRFDDDPRLARLLDDARLHPVVLFPSRDALDLAAASPAAARAFFPADKRPLVIVLDGTWATTRKLLHLSPRLAALPRICFTPAAPARYHRIRREPRAECRSTIEAAHQVIEGLAALEVAAAPPDRAHDVLLALLDALVREQVAFEPPGHRRGPAPL